MGKAVFLFVAMVVFSACSRNLYKESNQLYKKQAKAYGRQLAFYPLKDSMQSATSFVGTTNFNMRKPNVVVIHHTAQNSCEQTLKTFTKTATQVSAHYVICKDGTVFHMLNDYLRAWHGGVGSWGNITDVNSSSIGIELDNNGHEPFSEAQINSLHVLLGRLKKTHNIPTANFVGHADIAPGRKVDPSNYFPWQNLADKGFGLWYGDTTQIKLPDNFDALLGLRVIGYSIKNPAAAISAFKLRYKGETVADNRLSATDQKIIYSLMQQVL